VAEQAEARDHHPDIDIRWRTVTFALVTHSQGGITDKDVELAGHTFRRGDAVLVNYASANRDEEVFVDAHRCVIDRRDNRHLGFGAGVHRCLGSNLARLELHVGLEQVLTRLRGFEPDPSRPAVFKGNSITRGFRSLPVVFDRDQASVT